jgi:hypothetical protein
MEDKKQPLTILENPFSQEDFEVYNYNTHLDFTLFIWPLDLMRFAIFWDALNGYGFAFGPIYLVLRITPMIRVKKEILRDEQEQIVLSYCCQKSIKFDHNAESYKTAFICNKCKQYLNEQGGKLL